MHKRGRKRPYDKVLTEHSEGHEYNPSDKVGIELELEHTELWTTFRMSVGQLEARLQDGAATT